MLVTAPTAATVTTGPGRRARLPSPTSGIYLHQNGGKAPWEKRSAVAASASAPASIAVLGSARSFRLPLRSLSRARSRRRTQRTSTALGASHGASQPVSVSEPAVQPGVYGTSEENDAHFESQRSELERLAPLREALLRCDGDLAMKTARVDADPSVRAFVHANGPVARVLSNIDSEDSYLLKAAVAAGQTHVLENVSTEDPMTIANALVPLVRTLRNVETFYDTLGGVVGYQFAALELIHEQFGGPPPSFMSSTNHDSTGSTDDEDMMASNQETIDMHRPVGPDLREDGGAFATKAAMWGLEEMPRLAEVYPLGGAGDRLGLVDEMTGESLPAALLSYNGRTLIEGLIRDLTAREWLYYKVFGKQHVTPVAAMTSAAKGNHSRISTLIAQHDYFGRGESSFRLFEQPLVPVVTTLGGRWVTEGGGDLCVSLKPGGHGAIWKLMHDQGVFTWLDAKGRKGATVRQITNPMAGTDTTILALAGVGAREDKALGFASCERHLGASEGVNVLVERESIDSKTGESEYSYGISNVEYTVLEQHGIDDQPVDEGSDESAFPANTNVLYIGLDKIREGLLSSPRGAFPGMLVNLSKPATADGCKGGRLETSMQNIADVLLARSRGTPLDPTRWGDLPTFVLYTLRRRVTSSAKKKRNLSLTPPVLAQTPDGSFLDLVKNAADLLDKCGVSHPDPQAGTVEDYLANGPGFIFCTNPAVGPTWQVTEQKIRGGAVGERSEVRLEIAEVEWVDTRVDGSLLVEATAPLGATRRTFSDGSPTLKFGEDECGRCRLRDVVIENAGVDWSADGTVIWSAQLTRTECCEIYLEGNAEFDAKGVTLKGGIKYKVPNGWRLELRASSSGTIVERWTDLAAAGGGPSWNWRYVGEADGRVRLSIDEREIGHHGSSMETAKAAVAQRNKNTFSAPGMEREPLREKNGKNGAGASVRKGEVKKGSATREGSPAR
jgi:UTP---glucose-1-phosphate uridylyltransferase